MNLTLEIASNRQTEIEAEAKKALADKARRVRIAEFAKTSDTLLPLAAALVKAGLPVSLNTPDNWYGGCKLRAGDSVEVSVDEVVHSDGWRSRATGKFVVRVACTGKNYKTDARRYALKDGTFNHAKALEFILEHLKSLAAENAYLRAKDNALDKAKAFEARMALVTAPASNTKVSVRVAARFCGHEFNGGAHRIRVERTITPQLIITGLTEEQMLVAIALLQANGILPGTLPA